MTQKDGSAKADASVSYVVDPARCAELGRSLEEMLLARRCPKCQEEVMRHPKERAVDRQVKGIVECCSKREGYIKAEMPLLEIAFRVILGRGNQPITLPVLHDIVAEQWATPTSPKNITPEGLRRILGKDRYYGIREVPSGG